MKQLYSKKSPNNREQPTNETIQFLVNYSKSLHQIKTKSNLVIELNLN